MSLSLDHDNTRGDYSVGGKDHCLTKEKAPAEIRVKDPKTGAEKGSKLARFDLIPSTFLWNLAEVYGKGAQKYAQRNWEAGYSWGLSIAAMQRHLHLWIGGHSYDEETGCHHLAQVAWHCATLMIFELFGLGTDDRSNLRSPQA